MNIDDFVGNTTPNRLNEPIIIFDGTEKFLTREKVRAAIFKLCSYLRAEPPDNKSINFFFADFKDITPKVFKKTCILIKKYHEGRCFPPSSIWQKYIQMARADIKSKESKKPFHDGIPENEKPTKKDWEILNERIATIAAKSTVDVVSPPNNFREREAMRKQVEKMQKLRAMTDKQRLEYYCKVKKQDCKYYQYCRDNKKYCENVKKFVKHFRKD